MKPIQLTILKNNWKESRVISMKRLQPPAVCSRRAVSALLFAVLVASPAWAARLVVFGDSWGVPAASALAQVMAERGVPETTYDAATGGETAANLASPSSLAQNGPARLLSIAPSSSTQNYTLGQDDGLWVHGSCR